MSDLVLPAFEMDCRDWIVASPDEAGIPDDLEGAPILAALSTVLIGDADLVEVTGVLTVGLLDEDTVDDLDTRQVAPGAVAHELLASEPLPDSIRYFMPAPDRRLAVIAEFAPTPDIELQCRIESLMASFRWQSR